MLEPLAKKMILTILSQEGRPMGAEEVANRLQRVPDPDEIHRYLGELLERGKVRRAPGNLWRIAN